MGESLNENEVSGGDPKGYFMVEGGSLWALMQ